MDKLTILSEIRRTAEENAGKPLGKLKFSRLTGINEWDWSGVFWSKWSEAILEAGLSPNTMQEALSNEFILEKYAILTEELGHVPTNPELRIKAKNDSDFPSHSSINRFGSKKHLIGQSIEFCRNSKRFSNLVPILEKETHELPSENTNITEPTRKNDGYVYLMQFGSEYKIGNSNNVERRFRELKTQMPYEGKIVHTIATGDPEGIEAYWHQYFSSRRLKGEWFDLNKDDVRYFRKRTLM